MLKLKERLPSKGGVPKKGETYPGVKLKVPKGPRLVMDILRKNPMWSKHFKRQHALQKS